MPLDANEQYLLELINRGRLDPSAELARYNAAVASGAYSGSALSSLNSGLAAGTIGTAALQPLAPNEALNTAAANHSRHMLAVDRFAHSGIGDGDPGSRATSAGYSWTSVGENISWRGTTGTVNQLAMIEQQYFGLFESSGHRANTFRSSYSEAGLGAEVGQFLYGGRNYNSSMLTEMFGDRGSQFYVTGVTYNDTNGNRFYTPGEGISAGISVSGIGGTSSSSAGGYSIAVASGTRQVTLGGATVQVIFSGQNIKLDLVNGNTVMSSASVTAIAGIAGLELLGNAALSATGAANAESIFGNVGNNVLNGMAGSDAIYGRGGADTIYGGVGNDTIHGQAGNDTLNGGAGADRFGFSAGLSASTNVDRITDFVHGLDDLVLTKSIFASIGAALDLSELRLGTAALDANDFLIYNRSNGQLFYDANGSGAGGQVLFATLAAGTVLDTSDFALV